jgi:TonB-linked SusC/RagA family outer membrane protein
MRAIRCLSLALFLLVASDVGAQQITGRVLDQQTGRPLSSVQVFIAGAGIGALSQQNGRYLLLNVPVGSQTISAQRIGYRSVTAEVTVTAGGTVVRDFALSEAALGLDEIIVTGTPGGTQRRAIGNSVTSVAAADVTQTVAVNNMQDLLTGRSPGLQFTRVPGSVGAGAGIDIRGVGSFTLRSDPLIYVDGIRINNNMQSGPKLGSRFGEANPLNDINPQDIESIEIIKGPAAATLYGTEASAGVIQIITKRGTEGGAQFDLSVSEGMNYMNNPAARLGEMWACRDSFRGVCDVGSAELFSYNMYDEANKMIQAGAFPWPRETLYQNGLKQNYNLEVRGGTPNVRYYLSGNYSNEEGIQHYNWDKGINLRANVNLIFNDNFSFDASTGYVDGETRFMSAALGDGGDWTDMAWSNGYCLPRINPTACERVKGFQEHLPSDVAKLDVRRAYNRFTGSGTLNYTNGGGITARAIIGVDRGVDVNTSLWPLEAELPPVYEETAVGEVTEAHPITQNISLDLSATVRKDLPLNLGSATSVGAQYYTKTFTDFSVKGVGFAHPASSTINATPAGNATLGYDFVENKSLGFYVQEELNLNERFFLTAAVRFDDNSAFGANFEPVTYPKFAGTWVISEESFWTIGGINSLRLRGAWGKAGRQPDAFAGASQYGVISGAGGKTALQPISPGNTEVGPETSTELELGFDLALLDDRVAVEFSWFDKRTEGALLGIAQAPSVGFPGAYQRNVGRIDNWGWELSLNNRIYESEALSFRIDLTASHVDNEIVELGDFPGTNNIRIGFPYPNTVRRQKVVSATYDPNGTVVDLWGRRIAPSCDAGVKLGSTSQHGLVPGGATVPCKETSGKRMLSGPAFATYVFSVNPRIALLDNTLTLHVLVDAKYGRNEYDTQAGWGCYWQNCKPGRVHDDPVFVSLSRLAYENLGQYDTDFWKLREVGIQYILPGFMLDILGAERASLSVSGRNLGIIWQRQPYTVGGTKSMDPEFGNPVRGVNAWFTAPPTSSMTATMRVSF